MPIPGFFRLRSLMAAVLAAWVSLLALTMPATAADRDNITAFLEVTGFDVALDSIAQSAGSAPQMLGIDADAFGDSWTRLAAEVFDTTVMRGIALDILEQTLRDEALGHAAGFYATDLGQRLVLAENASHMNADDDGKQAEGMGLIADMVNRGDPRLGQYKRMNAAIDAADSSLRAYQEIQIRFLLAASAAGVIDLRVEPDQLRAMIEAQQMELRMALQQSALAGSAYTYQSFSDADVQAYVEALEQPLMKEVYALLNAVQYEIMANRFEVLAVRMAELEPGQDI